MQYVSTRRLWQDVCSRFWFACVGGCGLVALELWIKGTAGTLGDQQVVARHLWQKLHHGVADAFPNAKIGRWLG